MCLVAAIKVHVNNATISGFQQTKVKCDSCAVIFCRYLVLPGIKLLQTGQHHTASITAATSTTVTFV